MSCSAVYYGLTARPERTALIAVGYNGNMHRTELLTLAKQLTALVICQVGTTVRVAEAISWHLISGLEGHAAKTAGNCKAQ